MTEDRWFAAESISSPGYYWMAVWFGFPQRCWQMSLAWIDPAVTATTTLGGIHAWGPLKAPEFGTGSPQIVSVIETTGYYWIGNEDGSTALVLLKAGARVGPVLGLIGPIILPPHPTSPLPLSMTVPAFTQEELRKLLTSVEQEGKLRGWGEQT